MSREELAEVVEKDWDELVEAACAPPPPEVWITRPELAARWKVPKSTLDQWAYQHRGPRYASFGRHVRYRLSDVLAFEEQQFGGDAA